MIDEAIDYMTAETQTFIKHYAMRIGQLKAEIEAAVPELTAPERATVFAMGLQLLAEPIRRDIERLQRDAPETEPSAPHAEPRSPWTRRLAPPTSDDRRG